MVGRTFVTWSFLLFFVMALCLATNKEACCSLPRSSSLFGNRTRSLKRERLVFDLWFPLLSLRHALSPCVAWVMTTRLSLFVPLVAPGSVTLRWIRLEVAPRDRALVPSYASLIWNGNHPVNFLFFFSFFYYFVYKGFSRGAAIPGWYLCGNT